jgi:hypothetical protein
MFGEIAWGAHQHCRLFFDEGESHVFGERFWERLTVELIEFGLGIVQIQLARSPFHEDEDAVLRFGGEVRLTWREGVSGSGNGGSGYSVLREQGVEGEHAETIGSGREEIAAGEMDGLVKGVHGVEKS